MYCTCISSNDASFRSTSCLGWCLRPHIGFLLSVSPVGEPPSVTLRPRLIRIVAWASTLWTYYVPGRWGSLHGGNLCDFCKAFTFKKHVITRLIFFFRCADFWVSIAHFHNNGAGSLMSGLFQIFYAVRTCKRRSSKSYMSGFILCEDQVGFGCAVKNEVTIIKLFKIQFFVRLSL